MGSIIAVLQHRWIIGCKWIDQCFWAGIVQPFLLGCSKSFALMSKSVERDTILLCCHSRVLISSSLRQRKYPWNPPELGKQRSFIHFCIPNKISWHRIIAWNGGSWPWASVEAITCHSNARWSRKKSFRFFSLRIIDVSPVHCRNEGIFHHSGPDSIHSRSIRLEAISPFQAHFWQIRSRIWYHKLKSSSLPSRYCGLTGPTVP